VCVPKSMYVTFSFAFSSRYAKTRTSNYSKVVWQHTECMVGSIIWILLEFSAVIGVLLFWDTLYILSVTAAGAIFNSVALRVYPEGELKPLRCISEHKTY